MQHREIFRRAESHLKICLGRDSTNIDIHGHMHFCCTSMAAQKPVSPACVAGHLSRGCPTPSGTEKLKLWSLIQFRLEGSSGSWSADQPYCSSYIGGLCLPSLGSAVSLCLCPQHQFICVRVG